MNDTKLIVTLSALNSEEWRSYRRFLLTQTGEKSDNFRLFSIIQERKNNLSSLESAELLRTKYFPAMNSKGFSNMMSRLFQWLEEWLIIFEMQKDEIRSKLILLKTYNDRGLFNLANQTYRRIDKLLSLQKELDLSNYALRAQFYHYQYYSDNHIKYEIGGELFEHLLEAHMANFKEQSILYLAELNNLSRIKNYDFGQKKDQLQNSLASIPPSDLSIQLETLEALVSNNEINDLHQVKDFLFSNTLKPNSETHTLVTMYLLGSGLKIWQEGKLEDPQLIAELYDYGLQSGVLMQSGNIPVVRFHNIVATLGPFHSYEWAQSFINKWIVKVDAKSRESTLSLAQAQNCFYNEKYDLILPLLSNIVFEDLSQKTRALGLLIIALYIDRKNNYQLLRNNLSNFSRLLKRNKSGMSQKYYSSYKNLVDVVKRMQIKDFKKITINLDNYDNLIYRKWLSNQIK